MIKGILASIGLILILKQIPHAVGFEQVLFDGNKSFNQPDGYNTFSSLFYVFKSIHYRATLVALFSLAVILFWESAFFRKRFLFLKFFPSALAAVLLSIALGEIFAVWSPEVLSLREKHKVALPVANSITDFIGFFNFPDWSALKRPQVYSVALSIAFIASLESLLSTEAGDRLDPYKRRTSTNHELKAQGIGNIIAGMIGGIPVTAVIVRTSANVTNGGRTKIATMTHGILMMICVVSIPTLLNKIPLSSLSAVLFVVGYRLTSIKLFFQMIRLGRRQYVPFFGTIIGVMFTDLISGIMIGATISVFIILRDSYLTPFVKEVISEENKTFKMILSEEVTFLNKAKIRSTLDKIADDTAVIIDATRSQNIDDDVLEILKDFNETAHLRNVKVEFVGISI